MYKLILVFLIVIIPASAMADELCETLTPFAEKINADEGSRLDRYTINLGAALMCNSKTLEFKKKLLIPFSSLNKGWKERKQLQWNQIYCDSQGAWLPAIKDGWTVATSLISSEGEYFYMKAECN